MTKEAILEKITPVLKAFDVPLRLVSAIIQVESSWNPQARGDYRGGQPTSFGLFQLHRGGQAPPNVSDEELCDPVLNTRYAMPYVETAWKRNKGSFDPSSAFWWQSFAIDSGHPGGSHVDPVTIDEARALRETYAALDGAEHPPHVPITPGSSYTVRSGDTMSAIARRFDMSLSALLAANPQVHNPDLIQVGEMLHISPLQEIYPGSQQGSQIPLSRTGEVAEFAEAEQFLPGKTQFACGFFACEMARSMVPVGQIPKLTPQQIIDEAERLYARYDGDNLENNSIGMSLDTEDRLLREIGLAHWPIDNTNPNMKMALVKRWLEVGYPVLLMIQEVSVTDLELGFNPYRAWNTVNYIHSILVTGVTPDGNVLCRDSANCRDLHDPYSLRPGPRKYKASELELFHMTVISPSWLPAPTSDIPPAVPPEEPVPMIDLSNPWVAAYFTQVSTNPDRWRCKNGKSLFAGILHGWRLMNGAPRLPIGDEVKVPGKKSALYQQCESGILLYDPEKELDAPNGPWAPCYLLKLDSSLAKKLLGIEGAVPVGSSELTSRLTNAAAALEEAQRVLKETSSGREPSSH